MSAVHAGRPHLHARRTIAVGVLAVAAAFLVQTAVLPATGLMGAVPLAYTVVAVLGLAWGAPAGAIAGFAAGLLLDVTGTGVLGVQSLVACLLGYAAARIPVDRWRWSGLGWLILAVLLAQIGTYALDVVLGGRTVSGPGLLWAAASAAVCAVVVLPGRTHLRAVVR